MDRKEIADFPSFLGAENFCQHFWCKKIAEPQQTVEVFRGVNLMEIQRYHPEPSCRKTVLLLNLQFQS